MAKKNVWKYNFAQDPKVRDRVKSTIIPKLKEIRRERIDVEAEWLKFFYMWQVKHDGNHSYSGRAKLYIPEVRKNVEAQARQIVEAAFPNDNFFDCVPSKGGTKKGAEIHKSLRRWQIEQADLRVKYHTFARQEVLYGTSPVYIPWRKDVERVFRSAKDKKGRIKPTREMVELYNGPDFVVRDLMKWYAINPRKADILEDGCFEDFKVNKNDLVKESKDGMLYGLSEILEGSATSGMEELYSDIERAEAIGLNIGNAGYAGEASLSLDKDEDSKSHLCTLIFTKLVMPEACDEGEDPDLPIPLTIKVYNNGHVGTVIRNQFFHQRPPYLVGKYIIPNVDEFYGQGIPWAIQYMQYELNSKAEQSMDSATLALNPISFVDPGLAGQINDFNVEPGAIWFVSPQGVKMTSIPDTTTTGYQAISQLRAQMADYSDRTPVLPPQLAGKSRSATQSDIVDRISQTDMKTFQLQNEIMVLTPLMRMWESLTDQNITEDQIIMILGQDSKNWKQTVVSKKDTLGEYRYFWKASSDQQNKAILSRQIIDFMKVIGSLPPQTGIKVDFNAVAQMLWKEGLGLPDSDKVLGGEKVQPQDPEVLYKMIENGMEVEVLPTDDEPAMLQFLNGVLPEIKDQEIKDQVIKIMAQYRQQAQMKLQMIQQMRQQQQQQQMMIAQAQAQQGGGGGQPQAPGGLIGSGNRTQLSPNGSVGDMGSGIRP